MTDGIGSSAGVPQVSYYIDAVKDAGQRSRAIILLIIFMLFFSITALRNNYSPDWMLERLQVAEKVYTCIDAIWPNGQQQAKDVNSEEQCKPLKGMLLLPDKTPARDKNQLLKDISAFLAQERFIPFDLEYFDISKPIPILKDVLRERLLYFGRKELEIRQGTIPIISSAIDINDLWIVSGAVMAFLLYFLSRSYQQEIVNVTYIKEKFPPFFEVVKKLQVLAHFTRYQSDFIRLPFFMLPSIVQVWLLCEELKTYEIGKIINISGNNIQYFFILVSSGLLFWANYGAVKEHKALESLLMEEDTEQSGTRPQSNPATAPSPETSHTAAPPNY